jgi:hypothetical protein
MIAEHQQRPPTDEAERATSEARDLAQEMGNSFGQLVAGYVEYFGLTPEEARARTSDGAGQVERILASPPDQVSWFDLNSLERHAPGQAQVQWDKLKEAAREELRNGHRASRAVEGSDSRCWDRARFLALRSVLLDAVRPRSPLQAILIDQLAQWQVQLWEWQESLAVYSSLDGSKSARRNKGVPDLPRLSAAEAVEVAMRMVERFHRLYLQTLKALESVCRVPASVGRSPELAEQGALRLKVYG